MACQKPTQIPLRHDTGDSPAVSCPADTTQGTVPSIMACAFALFRILLSRRILHAAKVRLRRFASPLRMTLGVSKPPPYVYTDTKIGAKVGFAPKIFLKRGLFTIPAIFGDLDQSDALTNLHAKGRIVLICIRVANGGIVLQAMIYGIFPHKVDCLLLAFSF